MKNPRYSITVWSYLLGQYRIQLEDHFNPTSAPEGHGDIIRELCTYKKSMMELTVEAFRLSDHPPTYAESLAKPWNCEGPGGRILTRQSNWWPSRIFSKGKKSWKKYELNWTNLSFAVFFEGGELTLVSDRQNAKVIMILSDIGFDQIQNCLNDAMNGKDHYKPLEASLDLWKRISEFEQKLEQSLLLLVTRSFPIWIRDLIAKS